MNNYSFSNQNLQALADKHFKEWQGSGIAPEMIVANMRSQSGMAPYEYLLYGDDVPRRNDGRITDGTLKRYRHVEYGGWWVNGIDPITGDDRMFGQFKPDQPRTDKEGKVIKYEQPLKVTYEPIFLRIPTAIARKIAARYKLEASWLEASADGVSFWEWAIARVQLPIWITEGVKKAAALISEGHAAIALTSITTACVPKPKDETSRVSHIDRLLPDLTLFCGSGRVINIAFDQDAKAKTQHAVYGQIKRVGKLFERKGCKVNAIIWEAQHGKGIDDLIAGHPDWEEKIQTHPLQDYIGVKAGRGFGYPVDQKLNQRYLGKLNIPEQAELILIKSPKGTGKTESISEYLQQFLNQGYRVMLLSHRRQLCQELCNRLGIDYIDEILSGSETRGIFGYGLCVDSLHDKARLSFNLDSFLESSQKYIVLIDECEQVLWHTLNAKTEVKKNRIEVIHNVNDLLKHADKVILSDADLSYLSVNYVQRQMIVQKEDGSYQKPIIYSIKNEYTGKGYNCYHYKEKDPSRLIKQAENLIRQGQTIFIQASAQGRKSKQSTTTLEKYFCKKYPDKKIIRIDSETVADPTHPAYGCMTKLNELVIQYDIVIASPTIETGVSIDVKHFDAVFGIFCGVQTTDAARQALMRVRDNVPRYIWIAKRGLSKIGNGSANTQKLLESSKQSFGLHARNLAKMGLDGLDPDPTMTALETWAKFGARINWGNSHYRTEIIEGLKDEGHCILEPMAIAADDVKAIGEALTQTRDDNYQEYCEQVCNADDLTPSEFETLDRKQAKTERERIQHRKGQLQQRYGHRENIPDFTSELVKADDKGLYGKLRLDYYLTVGRIFVDQNDRRSAQRQKDAGQGQVWIPDFNRTQWQSKVQCLEFLGIETLLQQREWSKDDPELVAIAAKCHQYANDIKTLLGITINEKMTPIQIAQTLLGLIGYCLPYLRQEGNGRQGKSKRVRIYGSAISLYDPLLNSAHSPSNKESGMCDGRTDIFIAWYLKDLADSEEEPMGGVAVA
jgi:hypothetical protein